MNELIKITEHDGKRAVNNFTTHRPFNAFALSQNLKQETLARIDRSCSLYYVTMGSIYNVCQTAMVDARQVLKDDKSLYRHLVKFHVNEAFKAYDAWNASMQRVLKDRYQMWLDVSDSVDSDLSQRVQVLYYSIDNFFLKSHVPKSKIFARMETALVLLDIAHNTFQKLFQSIHDKVGVDISHMFAGADARNIYVAWHKAITQASRATPNFPDIDVNADPNSTQAVHNIINALTSERIYNRAGEYAIRLNPDQWHHLSKEDRLRLKKGAPLSQEG